MQEGLNKLFHHYGINLRSLAQMYFPRAINPSRKTRLPNLETYRENAVSEIFSTSPGSNRGGDFNSDKLLNLVGRTANYGH